MVRRLILAIAINAPVLPDETAAPARPCFTISMAIPIEVVLARRIAWLGRSLDPIMSGAWTISECAVSRSEERRVGKECVSTCRSRWPPDHYKKKKHRKRQSARLSYQRIILQPDSSYRYESTGRMNNKRLGQEQ